MLAPVHMNPAEPLILCGLILLAVAFSLFYLLTRE
jgi:hypothetical protein